MANENILNDDDPEEEDETQNVLTTTILDNNDNNIELPVQNVGSEMSVQNVSDSSTITDNSSNSQLYSANVLANVFTSAKECTLSKQQFGDKSQTKSIVSQVIWKYHKFPEHCTFVDMVKGEDKYGCFDSVMDCIGMTNGSRDLKIDMWMKLCTPMCEEVKRLRNEKNNTVKKKYVKVRRYMEFYDMDYCNVEI